MTAPWAWPSSRAWRRSPSTAPRRAAPKASSARTGPGPDSIAERGASSASPRPSASAATRHSPVDCARAPAGCAESTRYGALRSQRTSAALAAANVVAPADSASNRSLIVLALVRPSISSARLIATAAR